MTLLPGEGSTLAGGDPKNPLPVVSPERAGPTNRAAILKPPGPTNLRIRIASADGLLLVYDAVRPDGDDTVTEGYLACWNDPKTQLLYVFERILFDTSDVGHAVRNLKRDLDADPDSVADLVAWVKDGLTQARAAPEDFTVWQIATRRTLLELMGFSRVGQVLAPALTINR
jgi:hypothetical protein